MPKHLASNCGTKKDRVICQFYSKVGACLHGNRCKWFHNRPTSSPTLLLSNMYQRLDNITPGNDAEGNPIDPHKLQEHFEDFYEDIFEELSKHGEIESLIVCDNLADHMIGNVYVQFRDEGQAEAAMKGLRERPYKGRPIIVDFSPVTDFYEATCGQFKVDRCNKGADCNYIHVKQISPYLRKQLYSESRSRSRSRSRSPSYRRDIKSRERSHERGDHRRSSERDIESERRTRSKGRSRSLRESRERSHERGDHRRNSERNIGKERGLREGQEAKGGRGEES